MNGVRSRKECISIHAPTRGATSQAGRNGRCGIFQSTLPRGERHKWIAKKTKATNFNPRSHEGSDLTSLSSSMSEYDFNPRSHEGSDCNSNKKTEVRTYFNPRSHEGSDEAILPLAEFYTISIHAPTRGATSAVVESTPFASFQSTLPRGERPAGI